MLFSLLIATALVTNAFGEAPKCQKDWKPFEDENSCLKALNEKKLNKDARQTCNEATCLKFFNERLPYYHARQTCQKAGGDLVIPDSQAKNDFAMSLIPGNSNIWIGVRDKNRNRKWTYVDGSPLRFINWASRQPNNYRGKQHCGHFQRKQGGRWGDGNCGKRYKFMCQLSATVEQVRSALPSATYGGYDWVKNDQTGVSVKVFNHKKLSFDGARRECQAMGGDLVTKEQINFVRVLPRSWWLRPNLWLGIHDRDRDGTYNYLDESPVEGDMPFGKRQPTRDTKRRPKRCLVMRFRGRWYNRPCRNRYNFICQKRF